MLKAKRFITIILVLGIATLTYADNIEKVVSLHHSVTENGNIQVRQVVDYVKNGISIGRKYGSPYTPEDVNNMGGFDDRSKEIVAAIITPETKAALKAEKQSITGRGVEEQVSYDRVIRTDGRIEIRKIIRTFDDGVEVSKIYYRSWINPGDSLEGRDVISKAVAKKLHTQTFINAYKLAEERLE